MADNKELKANFDDGSQDFFDDLTKRRIRKMGFDRGIMLPSSQYIAKMRQMEVKEENAKRAIIIYKNAPHVSPTKNTVNLDYESFANRVHYGFMQNQRSTGGAAFVDEQMSRVPPHLRARANNIVESLQRGVNPFPQHNLLKETLGQNYNMNQMMQQQQSMHNAVNNAGNPGPSMNSCRIMQGCAVFKTIETQGFGSKAVLARSIGQADPRTASHQYIFREVVEAYIVQPNQKVVDMALLENNPQMKSKLAVLQAPQLAMLNASQPLGLILVPLDAIVKEMMPGQQYGNRTIIADSRYGVPVNRNQQPVARPGNVPTGKTILRG